MNPSTRHRRRRTTLTTLLTLLVVALGLGTAAAAASPSTPLSRSALAPVSTCAHMAQLDLGALPGAATEITSATSVAAKDNTHGPWDACDVRGTIAPQIQFELLLATTTWQGDYLQDGCGGYCGGVGITTQAAAGCAPLTDGAFAIASDNEGHYGAAAFSASFGADPTLRASFGYQSEHQPWPTWPRCTTRSWRPATRPMVRRTG